MRHFLNSPFAQDIGVTLVHSLWQIVIVSILFAIANRLLVRRSANLRYVVAYVSLLLMLAVPALTLFAISTSGTANPKSVAGFEPPVFDDPIEQTDTETRQHFLDNGVLVFPVEPMEALPTTSLDVDDSEVTEEPQTAHRFGWVLPWLSIGWVAGVILFSLRPFLALRRCHQIRKQAQQVEDSAILAALESLCSRIGLKRTVQIAGSALVHVPTVMGLVQPIILLPFSMLSGQTPEELSAIIAHELAHVRRHDFLFNLFQTAIETLLFYHPAVWWVSAVVRQERENCCDDIAMSICGRKNYATVLANLESSRSGTAGLAMAANGGSLYRRIHRIVRPHENPNPFGHWLAALIAMMALALVIASIFPMSSTALAAEIESETQKADASEKSVADDKSPATADGILAEAAAKEKEGDFAKAAQLYEEHLIKEPEDNPTYGLFAKCLIKKVDAEVKSRKTNAVSFEQASAAIEKALRKVPDDHDLRRESVDFFAQFFRLDDAISHLKILLDGDQHDEERLRVRLAKYYAQSQQDAMAIDVLSAMTGYDTANKSFDNTKASAPKSIEAYRFLVAIVLRQHDKKGALAIANQMVAANPDSYESYVARAPFLPLLGKADEVERDILKAVDLAPTESLPLLSAGDFYLRAKAFDKAEKYYKECLKQLPDEIGAYRGLASLNLAKRNYDEAVIYLNKGLERDEHNVAMLWARVNIELDKREFEHVAATRAKLESLNYPSPFLEFLGARVDLANEKWLDASKAFQDVRPQIAQYRRSWLPGLDGGLALCFERMGQHDLRLKACERILEAQPENLYAHWDKVQSLLAMGQLDKAVDEYVLIEKEIRAFAAEDAQNATIRAMLQMELLKQERLPEDQRSFREAKGLAKAIYDRGMLKDPATARVVESYYKAIGEPEKGAELLAKVKDTNQDNLSLFLGDVQKAVTSDGFEKALQVLNEGASRFDNKTAIRVTKCELLARIRPDECREELRLLESDLDSIPANKRNAAIRGIGRVYLLLNEFGETRRLWERLAEAQPQDVRVLLSIFELGMQENNEEAMVSATKRVEKLVGIESAEWKWCEAARIAWRVRSKKDAPAQLKKAERLLLHAIAKRDGWDALYRLLGELHAMQNQPLAAIDALEKSLQLSVGHPNVYQSLARLYYEEGRFDSSERMLDLYPKTLWSQTEERMKMDMLSRKGELPEKLPYDENSKDPSDHEWVGKLLTNVGRIKDAETAFKKAIQIEPDRPTAWKALIEMYVVSGDNYKAGQLLIDPRSPLTGKDGHRFRGETFAAMRKWKQSLTELDAAAKLDPDDVAIQRALVDINMKAGNRERADQILDELLEDAKANDPATKDEVRWARRAKAELLGNLRTYRHYIEAVKLVEANGIKEGENVRLEPPDMLVLVRLSLARPDGFSQKQAIEKLIAAENYRDLTEAERRVLADLYQRQDRWGECKSVMLDLLTDHPKDIKLLDPWLTWLLDHNEELLAARWVKNCPQDSVTAIRTLAQLDVRQGRSRKAAERLNLLIPDDLQTKDSSRLQQVGILFEQLAAHDDSLYSDAEKSMRRYVAMQPNDTMALAGFLGRRGRKGDVKEAIELCAKQFKTETAQQARVMAIGILRRNRQMFADGGTEIEIVRDWFENSQKDSNDPGLMIQRAEFENLFGEPDEAQKWLAEYLKQPNISPSRRAIVANNLAYMLALQGETERSTEYMKEAIEILGPTADVRDTTGMIYFARREYTKAIREFEAAIDDDGATAYKYARLSMAHFGNENPTESANALKRAISMGLDTRNMSKLEFQAHEKFVNGLKSAGVITDADLTRE